MEIRTPGSPADFEAAHRLIGDMRAWDTQQSRGFGVSDTELLEYAYGDTAGSLMEKFSRRGAGFFLASTDQDVAGCVGYARSDDGIAELQKMYVRPEARGKGIARSLMAACLNAMRNDGYAVARLETVSFMTEAIALYDAFGFKRCSGFRSLPHSLRPITIFMEREI